MVQYELANRPLTLRAHVSKSDSMSPFGGPNHGADRIHDCVRI
jgi:hypothetical protein